MLTKQHLLLRVIRFNTNAKIQITIFNHYFFYEFQTILTKYAVFIHKSLLKKCIFAEIIRIFIIYTKNIRIFAGK